MNEKKKFISWRRVSTAKQHGSHLGLEAQKAIIKFFVERENGELIADYEECHSGTDLAGCKELAKAKKHCKETGATLIIAKTDRCRDTIEALQLYEEMNGNIYFCDLPVTDKFTLTLFFSLAEREAMIVSLRTKQALAAKKARGEKVGAAAPKWAQSYASKSNEQKQKEHAKHGQSKNERFLASRDVQAILKAIRNVFPEHCKSDDPTYWAWGRIDTKKENRLRLLALMLDYKQLDTSFTLFADWDLSDFGSEKLRVKLASIIKSIKRALDTKEQRNNN